MSANRNFKRPFPSLDPQLSAADARTVCPTIGIQLRGPERSEGLVIAISKLGGALLVEDVVGALACERLTELKLTAGRERV